MKDKIRIRGQVTIKVIDKDGNVKRCKPGVIQMKNEQGTMNNAR